MYAVWFSEPRDCPSGGNTLIPSCPTSSVAKTVTFGKENCDIKVKRRPSDTPRGVLKASYEENIIDDADESKFVPDYTESCNCAATHESEIQNLHKRYQEQIAQLQRRVHDLEKT